MFRIKSIALFLIFILIPLSSFAETHCFEYTIGEQLYELELTAGSEYRFYLPFDSDYMTVAYSTDDDYSIGILINGEIELSHDISHTENSAVIYFPEIIRKGSCTLDFMNNGNIVESIVFHKVPEAVSYSGPMEWTADMRPEIEFTDYEDAIRTAVIINNNSPVIKVCGADRYVDYDAPSKTPLYEDGITYLPIDTFSRALGYYYELKENYFLLRAENIEFVFESGKLYRQDNLGEYVEISNNTLVIDDNIYIPVKFYAEAIGKTVLIKDGYTIIDCRELAENIINDNIYSILCEEFENYITSEIKNTYYVSQSPSASDDNPGTADEPFATLGKAAEVADAGDTVIIGAGVYREVLKPSNSGTADNPIIFKTADGADVTISALEEIGNPNYVENGLYVYNVDWDLGDGRNQVFYEGEALAEGRHPNTHTSPRYYPYNLDLSPLWPTQGNIQVTLDEVSDTATSTTDLNQEDDYWAGATLVTVHGYGYGITTAKISSSENGKLHLGKHSTRLWHTKGGSDASEHYDYAYITDSLNAVDAPGEWYWGDGKLYVYPPVNTSSETFELEGKRRQLTVDLSDNKYIQLIGINTLGGGMKLSNSEMCVINGGTHEYISHFTYTDDSESYFIDTRDSISDLFDEDAAVYRGEVGIYLSGKNNAFINTEIKHSAARGLILGGAWHYIENNLISETGYMGGGGISLFSSPLEDITIVKGGHSLYNNTIDKTARNSLNLSSWTYPLDQTNGLVPWIACEIAYNDLLNSNICTRDTGAVYAYGPILGDERRKLQFHHNVIANVQVSDGYGAGIYWDNYSQMVECYDNIVLYDNKKLSIEDHYLHIASETKFPETFSYVDAWNNMNAGYFMLGKAGLTANQYPFKKWFFTGYGENKLSSSTKESILKSSDALVSGSGVTFDKYGAAHLNQEDEWICFEDVDFSSSSLSVGIIYNGDRYNTGDKIEIAIGNNSYEVTLDCKASYKNNINEKIIPFDELTGVHDVYLKCVEYKSAGVLGINIRQNADSVNNDYAITVTDDENKYYVSGKADANANLIGAIANDSLHDIDIYDTGNDGEFAISLDKTEYNGAYKLKLFSWNDMTPLRESFEYVYMENRFKEAEKYMKFKDAEEYPRLISDGTVVSGYGNGDVVLFKNVDFRNSDVNALAIKYGINTSEVGKLTIKVYIDSIATEPILVFEPEDTVERWNRTEFLYDLEILDKLDGYHNVYFVIEGSCSLPIHLDRFKFEDTNILN